jgi:hypothetical protein
MRLSCIYEEVTSDGILQSELVAISNVQSKNVSLMVEVRDDHLSGSSRNVHLSMQDDTVVRYMLVPNSLAISIRQKRKRRAIVRKYWKHRANH